MICPAFKLAKRQTMQGRKASRPRCMFWLLESKVSPLFFIVWHFFPHCALTCSRRLKRLKLNERGVRSFWRNTPTPPPSPHSSRRWCPPTIYLVSHFLIMQIYSDSKFLYWLQDHANIFWFQALIYWFQDYANIFWVQALILMPRPCSSSQSLVKSTKRLGLNVLVRFCIFCCARMHIRKKKKNVQISIELLIGFTTVLPSYNYDFLPWTCFKRDSRQKHIIWVTERQLSDEGRKSQYVQQSQMVSI